MGAQPNFRASRGLSELNTYLPALRQGMTLNLRDSNNSPTK